MAKLASTCLYASLALALLSPMCLPKHASAYAVFDLNPVGYGGDILAPAEAERASSAAEEISSREELEAYVKSLKESDPRIKEITFTGNSVKFSYEEEGQFLAFIPVTFGIEVEAYADGRVATKYPWYSGVTVDKRDEIEREVSIAVKNALSAMMLGSVQGAGEYEPKLDLAQSAEVAAQIHAVLTEALKPHGSAGKGE